MTTEPIRNHSSRHARRILLRPRARETRFGKPAGWSGASLWRLRPEISGATLCRSSGDAAGVAAAEAVGGVGGDHYVVVAVLVGRPANGLGAAQLHGNRLGAALVVVRGHGVEDLLLALIGQRELDRLGRGGSRGGGDDRDLAGVEVGGHNLACRCWSGRR